MDLLGNDGQLKSRGRLAILRYYHGPPETPPIKTKWPFFIMNCKIEQLHVVRTQPIYPLSFICQRDLLRPVHHLDIPFGKFLAELWPWEDVPSFTEVKGGSFFAWARRWDRQWCGRDNVRRASMRKFLTSSSMSSCLSLRACIWLFSVGNGWISSVGMTIIRTSEESRL